MYRPLGYCRIIADNHYFLGQQDNKTILRGQIVLKSCLVVLMSCYLDVLSCCLVVLMSCCLVLMSRLVVLCQVVIVGGDGGGFTPKVVVAGCQQSGGGVQRKHLARGFDIWLFHMA